MKGTAMAVVLTVASASSCNIAVPPLAIKKGARLSHFSCDDLSSSCCTGLQDVEQLLEHVGRHENLTSMVKKDLIGACGRADQVNLYNCTVSTIPRLVPAGKEGKARALIKGKGCPYTSVSSGTDGSGQCTITGWGGSEAGIHQIEDVSAGCCAAVQAITLNQVPRPLCSIIGACGKQDQQSFLKDGEKSQREEAKKEEAKEKEEEKATEKEAKKNEVWCAKECLAQGYCCNDPSVGSNQMLSCAQACKMRATGMSTDVMLSSNGGVCNRNGASGCGVNWYSYYDLCDSCSDLTDKCPHGVEDKSECDFGASLNPPGAEFKKKSLAELLLLESYFTLGGSQDMLASLMASEVEDDATEDRPTEDGSQIMTGLLGFVAGAAVTGLGVTVLRRKSPSQDEYNQIVA